MHRTTINWRRVASDRIPVHENTSQDKPEIEKQSSWALCNAFSLSHTQILPWIPIRLRPMLSYSGQTLHLGHEIQLKCLSLDLSLNRFSLFHCLLSTTLPSSPLFVLFLYQTSMSYASSFHSSIMCYVFFCLYNPFFQVHLWIVISSNSLFHS